ncbi:GNAT family N-acetyltransferase [Rhizobium oryzicola]|uniref:GNAT family N-acetyltransferase n=1 Tax=Rhizobium oryzicola TaxID=1232668 RepID=A0ABT8STV2_9HYPH|nr:GNAT family N-acetyltransferase [Rhizobium oryzicola]MDO1581874.1 GNAT family N-acetyltransferase [Rhizobium oryzicola]
MLTIRIAREDEAAKLTDIGLRAWEQAMEPIGTRSDLRENALNAFAGFTQNAWLTISVADLNGDVVGWAAREGLDEKITDFWVDPDFLRQGVGSALLADIETQIRDQGFEEARLETHAQNTSAVQFFEKHGYRVSWLSVSYSPKLDQDVQSVGLAKHLVTEEADGYGSEF